MTRGAQNPITPISRHIIISLAETGEFTRAQVGAMCGLHESTVVRVLIATGREFPDAKRLSLYRRRVERVIAGERRISFQGYPQFYLPFHPHAMKDWVSEHRLVMERAIGRYLRGDELVHHRNEDKCDNRIENLEVMTKAQHQAHHGRARRKSSAPITPYPDAIGAPTEGV